MKNYLVMNSILMLVMLVSPRIASAQVALYYVHGECGKITTASVTTFPPLSTTMPVNVIDGYIVMDGLCRIGSEAKVDSLLNAISTDTLRLLMKFYYDVVDYDPILFMEYARASSSYAGYSICMQTIVEKMHNAYNLIHEYAQSDKLFTWTNYIYRVKVNSQSSSLDSSSRLVTRHFCANVEVIEKIKGIVLPDPSREIFGGGESGEGHMNIWWGQVEGNQKGVVVDDSARYASVREGYLVPGNEYVVFIDALPVYVSETDIGYQLLSSRYLTMSNSFAFPMQSGNIIDTFGYFGSEEKIPYGKLVHWIKSARDLM